MRSLAPLQKPAPPSEAARSTRPVSILTERTHDTAAPGAQGPPQVLAAQPRVPASSFFSHVFSGIATRSTARRPVQATLHVGPPDVTREREADRVADQVLRSADPRFTWEDGGPGQGGGTGRPAPPIVGQVIGAGGHPLDAGTRAFMEPRFGRDFGHIRVHADERAGQAAESIHARAFTAGPHIVFGAGEYAPKSGPGRRLLAHELAHTVQPAAGILRKEKGETEAEGLQSPLLVGSKELEMAFRGELSIGEGAAGDFVKRIQLALLAEDPAALPEFGADGRFGPETKAAIMAFQRRHRLRVDGIVGPQTMRALDGPGSQTSILATPGTSTAKPPKGSASGLVGERFNTPKLDPLAPLLPLLPGTGGETTFLEKEFPPVETAYGTLHRSLSLVGSAALAPVNSSVTLTREDMSLEFQAFATSLTFKRGKSFGDSSFHGMNVSLGDGKADVTFEAPSTINLSYGLPREVVLGRAKLSGSLKIVLKSTLIPRKSPPVQTVPVTWKESLQKSTYVQDPALQQAIKDMEKGLDVTGVLAIMALDFVVTYVGTVAGRTVGLFLPPIMDDQPLLPEKTML